MLIYKITNKINNMQYIGQTRQPLHKRWLFHVRAKKKVSRRISNAINKYGHENFIVEVLHVCSTQEEMNKMEVYYINSYNTLSPNGYNLTSGGESPLMSAETRLKMSLSKIGKPGNKKGSPPWNKGLKGVTKGRPKPVICLTTGITYTSVKEAANTLNLNLSKVSNVCTGLRKSTGGLVFAHLGGA